MLVEKYRPEKLEDVIGQEQIKEKLQNLIHTVKKGDKLPHLLFSGPPGVGKTTIGEVLAVETGIDIVEYNASDNRKIDFVRDEIKKIAETYGDRIVLLDEFDMMTNDAQHAMRRIMEKASCTFILTCNEEWRIIDAIKSRCVTLHFSRLTNENLMELVKRIIKNEKIVIEDKTKAKEALKMLLDQTNGDARKILNTLEGLISENKEFTPGNIELFVPTNFANEILEMVVSGDFDGGLKKFEDMYLFNKMDVHSTIKNFYDSIKNLKVNRLIKLKMYEKLGEIERNLKIGCHPLIQFASFLATCMISPQMMEAQIDEVH